MNSINKAELRALKKIVNKSKLTEKDALELGRKINKSLHERYETGDNSGENKKKQE